jgi:beta-glucosidase-like glycosyl hydrolase
VLAIEAGCDAVLLCGTDHGRQAAALEALVRAVESEQLPFKQVDTVLERHRRVRERFAASMADWRPPSEQVLRTSLGTDEHRAVAAEMRQYL